MQPGHRQLKAFDVAVRLGVIPEVGMNPDDSNKCRNSARTYIQSTLFSVLIAHLKVKIYVLPRSREYDNLPDSQRRGGYADGNQSGDRWRR
jgi:hypothetical protein